MDLALAIILLDHLRSDCRAAIEDKLTDAPPLLCANYVLQRLDWIVDEITGEIEEMK